MREVLERLLRSVDAPDPERAELLWAEYRAGGPGADAAFATLLAWYGGAIYRHIWGLVRSDAAEDVFQDVLAKLHQSRQKPRLARFREDVLPWLRTTAIRACVDAYRRTRRRQAREAKAARPEADTETESHRELQLAVADALAKLHADQRAAVALHYFEGLDKQDAAAALGINRDTLAARLNRALERLQKLIPAPAVLAAGATAGVPAALSAQPPELSPSRLA
jgi:RNA polymerase sigma-70 factor (ECF subfamily)